MNQQASDSRRRFDLAAGFTVVGLLFAWAAIQSVDVSEAGVYGPLPDWLYPGFEGAPWYAGAASLGSLAAAGFAATRRYGRTFQCGLSAVGVTIPVLVGLFSTTLNQTLYLEAPWSPTGHWLAFCTASILSLVLSWVARRRDGPALRHYPLAFWGYGLASLLVLLGMPRASWGPVFEPDSVVPFLIPLMLPLSVCFLVWAIVGLTRRPPGTSRNDRITRSKKIAALAGLGTLPWGLTFANNVLFGGLSSAPTPTLGLAFLVIVLSVAAG